MLSEWNLKAFINFRNSSPKARSAIPDSKWELGVCARVPPHKRAFCTPSRSSLEVFKVRIGSMGKNILGGKGEESPTQRQDILKFRKTGTLPDIFPLQPSYISQCLAIILLLTSLPLEGSPLFYLFILKSLPRENSIKLGFRQAWVHHVLHSVISEQVGDKARIFSRSLGYLEIESIRKLSMGHTSFSVLRCLRACTQDLAVITPAML